nr:hypothetical protein [Tanacetum cinerariifolium]
AAIPDALPIDPEAEATVVASPTGLRNMVIHLDSKSDPSEDPPLSDHAPVAPIIVPILLEDHSESDSEFRGPSAKSLEEDFDEMSIKESGEASSEASVGTGVEASIEDIVEGETRWNKEVIQSMYEHMLEIPVQMLEEIEDKQRTLRDWAETV